MSQDPRNWMRGPMVAMVSPFFNGKIDEACIRSLVKYYSERGIKVIVPGGCTGESFTLTYDEQIQIIELVCQTAPENVKVVAGTGSNSTAEALLLTKRAKEVGADGAMIITPYGNKPTQDDLIAHYTEIATSVDLPIMLYNVPSRTGVNMLPETVAKLSKVANIVAIKEASGNLEQIIKILNICDINVLSGDDKLILAIIAHGGVGGVSVAANLITQDFASLVHYCLKGQIKEAQRLYNRYLPLFEVLFCESNPKPIKYAMALVGLIDSEETRPPLFTLTDESQAKIDSVLRETLL